MTREVILPLRDGLSSLKSLYDSLLHLNHPFQNLTRSGDIRQLIVRAEKDMRRASEKADWGLRQLDQNTEELTEQQYTSIREREEKKLSLQNLETKLHGEKKSLETAKDALEQAKICLRKEKKELEKQRDRKNNAAVVTGVGIGLTIVPFVGWVAGNVSFCPLHHNCRVIRNNKSCIGNHVSILNNLIE